MFFTMYLAKLISMFIGLYIFVIVLQVAVSWLIVFKVLNTDNPQAQNLVRLLRKATDPVMLPVQKYVPPVGGLDLTPIVVIVGLEIIDSVISSLLLGYW